MSQPSAPVRGSGGQWAGASSRYLIRGSPRRGASPAGACTQAPCRSARRVYWVIDDALLPPRSARRGAAAGALAGAPAAGPVCTCRSAPAGSTRPRSTLRRPAQGAPVERPRGPGRRGRAPAGVRAPRREVARPFAWTFPRRDLDGLMARGARAAVTPHRVTPAIRERTSEPEHLGMEGGRDGGEHDGLRRHSGGASGMPQGPQGPPEVGAALPESLGVQAPSPSIEAAEGTKLRGCSARRRLPGRSPFDLNLLGALQPQPRLMRALVPRRVMRQATLTVLARRTTWRSLGSSV
jgi:hypothetical protein